MPTPNGLAPPLHAELRERLSARRDILRSLTALREDLSLRIDQLTEAVERLGQQARQLERSTMDSSRALDAEEAEAEVSRLVQPIIATESPLLSRPRLTAIGAEVAAMPRPITTDEIHALLDRASQSTASLAPFINRRPSNEVPAAPSRPEGRDNPRNTRETEQGSSQSSGASDFRPRRQAQLADGSDDRSTPAARGATTSWVQQTEGFSTPLFTSAFSDRWRVVRGGNLEGRPSTRENQNSSAAVETPAAPPPPPDPTPPVVQKKEIGRMAKARAKGCHPTNLRQIATMPAPQIVKSSRPRPAASGSESAAAPTPSPPSTSQPTTENTNDRSLSAVSSPLIDSMASSATLSLDRPGFDIIEFPRPDVPQPRRPNQEFDSSLTHRGIAVAERLQSNGQSSSGPSTARRGSTPMARAVGASSSLNENTLQGWPSSRQYLRRLGPNDLAEADLQSDTLRELRRSEAGSMRALARNIVDAQREIAEQQARPAASRPTPVPPPIMHPATDVERSGDDLPPGRSAVIDGYRQRLRELQTSLPASEPETAPWRSLLEDAAGPVRPVRPGAEVDDPIHFASWDTDGPSPASPTVRSQRPTNVQIEEDRAARLENDRARTDRLYSRIAAGRPLPLAVRRAFTQLQEEGEWTGNLEDVGSRVARASSLRQSIDIPDGVGGDTDEDGSDREEQEDEHDSDATVELINVVIETVVRSAEMPPESVGVLEGSGEREAREEPERRRVMITVPAPAGGERQDRPIAPSVVGIRDDDVETMNSSQLLERLMSQYASEPILGEGARVDRERQNGGAERGVQFAVGAERRAEEARAERGRREEPVLPESRGTRAAALVESKDPAEVPSTAIQPTTTRRVRPYISLLDL